MGGVHSFDRGFHKRDALGVDVTLETHEDTVGWQDANDMSLDGFTVPLAGENAVLDAAGEDAGRGIGKILQGEFHVLGEDGGLRNGVDVAVLFFGCFNRDGEFVSIEWLDADVGGCVARGSDHPAVVVASRAKFDQGTPLKRWNDVGSLDGFQDLLKCLCFYNQH